MRILVVLFSFCFQWSFSQVTERDDLIKHERHIDSLVGNSIKKNEFDSLVVKTCKQLLEDSFGEKDAMMFFHLYNTFDHMMIYDWFRFSTCDSIDINYMRSLLIIRKEKIFMLLDCSEPDDIYCKKMGPNPRQRKIFYITDLDLTKD